MTRFAVWGCRRITHLVSHWFVWSISFVFTCRPIRRTVVGAIAVCAVYCELPIGAQRERERVYKYLGQWVGCLTMLPVCQRNSFTVERCELTEPLIACIYISHVDCSLTLLFPFCPNVRRIVAKRTDPDARLFNTSSEVIGYSSSV